jgi:DNA invertase Pin-like site-specific DNA recombinase
MCAKNGWEIVGEYNDEKFSAYSGNRGPGLAAARAHAARVATETAPAMLVAQAADRFARGAGDRPGAADALVEVWHAERRHNVHLRSVEDDYDLRTSEAVDARHVAAGRQPAIARRRDTSREVLTRTWRVV